MKRHQKKPLYFVVCFPPFSMSISVCGYLPRHWKKRRVKLLKGAPSLCCRCFHSYFGDPPLVVSSREHRKPRKPHKKTVSLLLGVTEPAPKHQGAVQLVTVTTSPLLCLCLFLLFPQFIAPVFCLSSRSLPFSLPLLPFLSAFCLLQSAFPPYPVSLSSCLHVQSVLAKFVGGVSESGSCCCWLSVRHR